MQNEDGTLSMVFNGEIYNFPELRRLCETKGHRFRSNMDGEVILHLFEMEGPEAFKRLNGIFAVALVDRRSGQAVLARDPLGVKPLFYASDRDGRLMFGSEIGTLQALRGDLGSSDVVALGQFLTFLWIPEPRTPYRGVARLLPGHVLEWEEGRTRTYPYCNLAPDATEPMDEREAVRQLEEGFHVAAQRQLLADVPIGEMASGGVDSGLIMWATQAEVNRAYTIMWPTVGDTTERLDDDRRAVQILSDRFGVPVRYIDGSLMDSLALPAAGDLFADPAYGLTRLISKTSISEGMKVLLSGQGGDELFAGYRRHQVAMWLGRLSLGSAGNAIQQAARRIPSRRVGVEYAARVAAAFAQRDPFDGYMVLASYSTAADRARALDCAESEVSDEVMWQRHREVYDALPSSLSMLRKAMTVDLKVYLPSLGLSYVDRAGMEFGVEIRVPWLDLELVRWSLRLPDHLLVKRGRGKILPRALAVERLGPEVALRPKRPFGAPVATLPGGADGQRGFRQSIYFCHAAELLRMYLKGIGGEARIGKGQDGSLRH